MTNGSNAGVAVLEDDGRNRIAAAEPEDVGIVGVRSRGSNHYEVAASRPRSHGHEVLVDVGASALENDETAGRGSHVCGVADHDVFITGRRVEVRCHQ